VKCLLQIFNRLCENQEEKTLERPKFGDIMHNDFHMTDDILLDRIFRAFDKDTDNKVNAEEWVKGLSIFLRGCLKEKIKFCFDVYDMNSDGWITKEEMFHMLKFCLPQRQQEEDPDEGVRDLVECALKKLDTDQDSRVSFEDYTKAVHKDELLLECLGPCLPDQKYVQIFMESVEDPEMWLMNRQNREHPAVRQDVPPGTPNINQNETQVATK